MCARGEDHSHIDTNLHLSANFGVDANFRLEGGNPRQPPELGVSRSGLRPGRTGLILARRPGRAVAERAASLRLARNRTQVTLAPHPHDPRAEAPLERHETAVRCRPGVLKLRFHVGRTGGVSGCRTAGGGRDAGGFPGGKGHGPFGKYRIFVVRGGEAGAGREPLRRGRGQVH